MDYTLPRADNVPNIRFLRREVPCTTNPLGIKGAGEAGAIGAPPAIVNAVVNALTAWGQTCRHAAYPMQSGAFPAACKQKQIHASARLSGCRPIAILMHFSNQPLVFWSAVRGQIAFSIKRYFLNKHKFIGLASFRAKALFYHAN